MKKVIYQFFVLFFSITQFLSPLFSSFNGERTSENTNPQITPAGYAFAVWGVITLLAFLYGIYQVLPNRKNKILHQSIAKNLVIIYILFSVWLYAAAQNWLIITVFIFVTMFYFLVIVFDEVLKNKDIITKTEKVLLLGQIAIYTGWTTVAIFANTASAIKFYGTSDLGIVGTFWQSIILVGALFNSLYFIYKFQRNIVYLCTILWAFTGVFIGLLANKNVSILVVFAISAIITVFIFGLIPNRYLPKFYKNEQ